VGFFKNIGRKIGEAMSSAGRKTGWSWLENAGDKLQYACRETSKNTGSTREYDQDTATVDETAHIAEILSGFSAGLRGQGYTIEQSAKKYIEDYFDLLYSSMNAVLGQKTAVKNLMLQKQIIVSTIDGSFNDVLSTRVSLSDQECLKILKMPKGAAKEKAMNAFGSTVINEGIDKLCGNVQKSIEAIRKETESELGGMVEQQQRLLEDFTNYVNELANKRQKDIQDSESEILLPSQKLAASELLLELVQNGEVK